jgi:DNA polymerase III sliding clamp (beta) subunit (PCNA family)
MQIDKQELQHALEIVKPGLSNREIIEQSTSFAFLDGKVVTYNDEMSIAHPVEGLEIEEGAVQAEELYKFLSRVKSDTIELEISDNEIKIVAGKSEAGLTLHSQVLLPLEELGRKGKWKELPEDFTEALKFTAPTCSNDMSNPAITCVHVRDDGIVEATDNFRVTYYEIDSLGLPSFLLPASVANQLAKYDITQIARGEAWSHYKTAEGSEISCRKFSAEFPETGHLIDIEGSAITFPEELQEVIDRVAVFAKRDLSLDEEITIEVDQNRMIVSAQSDVGWSREEVPGKVENLKLKFAINPDFLSSILQKKYTAEIDGDRLRFDGDNWIHVVAMQVK